MESLLMSTTLSSESNSIRTHGNDTCADVFLRHRGPITSATPVPETDYIITSGYDGAVGIFNKKNRQVELLGYHDHLVNRVSVSADGRFAASCSSDYNIYLWDIKNKKRLRVLRGHNDDVEDFIFLGALDNKNLEDNTVAKDSISYGVSVSRDMRVLVWNLNSGAIEHILLGHEKDVLSVSHLEGKLYTSSDDMTLRIWDLASGTLIKTLGPFATEADTCAIDPIHRRVILGCDDGYIHIFDIESGEQINSLNAHSAGIKKVACSPKNGDILSAAYDQRVLVWDAVSLQVKNNIQYQASTWERSFNWSPDGQWLCAGTFDGTVLKWNAKNGVLEDEYGLEKCASGNACFNDVAKLSGDHIVVVSDDGLVRTGKLSSKIAFWQQIHIPENDRILMNAVTTNDHLSKQEHSEFAEIITGNHGQTLQRFNVSQKGIKQTLSTNLREGPINCVRESHHSDFNGEYFVACYTGTVVRVNRDGIILDRLRTHENAVKALALHPTEAIGVSCSADGVLASWDFSGTLRRTYPGHLAIIDDVDISPNGQLIASTGRDFTLKIHTLYDGALIHNIGLGRHSPKAVAFVDDHIVIVTNYWGELLRIDLTDNSVTCKKIAENGISGIVIRGDQLIVSSYDGGIYLVREHDLETLNSLRSMTQRIDSPAFGL